MAPSETKKKHPFNPRHRSHKGCWTCKRKRIQCDEARPACQKCGSRGVTCEGYEIRLRWGAGIASRGRYSGAEKPVKEFIPPPSKRRWDLRDKDEAKEESQDCQGLPVILVKSNSDEGIPTDGSMTLENEAYGAQLVRSMAHLNQPVYERPTVNILNVPLEDGQVDYMNIKKHFELPVSRDFGDRAEHLFAGREGVTPTQYPKTMAGRSALLV